VQNVEVAYLYKVRSIKKKYPPRWAAPPACRRQVKYNQLELEFTISASLSAAGRLARFISLVFRLPAAAGTVFLNTSSIAFLPNFYFLKKIDVT